MNSFVYFPLHFPSRGRVNGISHLFSRDEKKPATFTGKIFFSFFQKLYRTIEVVLERIKMQTFLVMWFQHWRVIHQTIIAGLQEKRLRSAIQARAVIVVAHVTLNVKPNHVNSFLPRDECQVRWAIRDIYWEIFTRVYMDIKSLPIWTITSMKTFNKYRKTFSNLWR